MVSLLSEIDTCPEGTIMSSKALEIQEDVKYPLIINDIDDLLSVVVVNKVADGFTLESYCKLGVEAIPTNVLDIFKPVHVSHYLITKLDNVWPVAVTLEYCFNDFEEAKEDLTKINKEYLENLYYYIQQKPKNVDLFTRSREYRLRKEDIKLLNERRIVTDGVFNWFLFGITNAHVMNEQFSYILPFKRDENHKGRLLGLSDWDRVTFPLVVPIKTCVANYCQHAMFYVKSTLEIVLYYKHNTAMSHSVKMAKHNLIKFLKKSLGLKFYHQMPLYKHDIKYLNKLGLSSTAGILLILEYMKTNTETEMLQKLKNDKFANYHFIRDLRDKLLSFQHVDRLYPHYPKGKEIDLKELDRIEKVKEPKEPLSTEEFQENVARVIQERKENGRNDGTIVFMNFEDKRAVLEDPIFNWYFYHLKYLQERPGHIMSTWFGKRLLEHRDNDNEIVRADDWQLQFPLIIPLFIGAGGESIGHWTTAVVTDESDHLLIKYFDFMTNAMSQSVKTNISKYLKRRMPNKHLQLELYKQRLQHDGYSCGTFSLMIQNLFTQPEQIVTNQYLLALEGDINNEREKIFNIFKKDLEQGLVFE